MTLDEGVLYRRPTNSSRPGAIAASTAGVGATPNASQAGPTLAIGLDQVETVARALGNGPYPVLPIANPGGPDSPTTADGPAVVSASAPTYVLRRPRPHTPGPAAHRLRSAAGPPTFLRP